MMRAAVRLSSAAKRRQRRRKHELYLKTGITTTRSDGRCHSTTTREAPRPRTREPLPLVSHQLIWTALNADACLPWCALPKGITQMIAAYANPLHLCMLGAASFLVRDEALERKKKKTDSDETNTDTILLEPASSADLDRMKQTMHNMQEPPRECALVQHHMRFLGIDTSINSWGTLPLPCNAMVRKTWYRAGYNLYDTSLHYILTRSNYRHTTRHGSSSSSSGSYMPLMRPTTCIFFVQPYRRTLVFHTQTHTWKSLAPLKVERSRAVVINLDNCLYCIGGSDEYGQPQSSCLLLQVCSLHSFHSPVSSPPPGRRPFSACYDDSEEFDAAVTALEARLMDGSTSSTDWVSLRKVAEVKREAELAANQYTDTTPCGQWSSLAPMKVPRGSACGVVCPNLGRRGSILIFGGHHISTCERYDIGTNTWIPLAEMPYPMITPVATLVMVRLSPLSPTTTMTMSSPTTTSNKEEESKSEHSSLTQGGGRRVSMSVRDHGDENDYDDSSGSDGQRREAVVLVFNLNHLHSPRGCSGLAYHVASDQWSLLPWSTPPCTDILQPIKPTNDDGDDGDGAHHQDLFMFDSRVGKLWVGNVESLDQVEWRVMDAPIPYAFKTCYA